jgi:hypothetical protein
MLAKLKALATLLIAAAIAGAITACGSRPTAEPAPPTALPPTPTLPAVTGLAENLTIRLEDLPGGFTMAGEDRPGGNAYSVVYLRPDVLAQQPPTSASLVGVIENLSILTDMAGAHAQFAAQGTDTASIARDVQEVSGNASNVDVQPYAASVAGADEVIAFRVRYVIGSTRLLEYRYRMRVGNVLVNLIVTATVLETEVESANIREQAQALAQKQVEHINDARR